MLALESARYGVTNEFITVRSVYAGTLTAVAQFMPSSSSNTASPAVLPTRCLLKRPVHGTTATSATAGIPEGGSAGNVRPNQFIVPAAPA